MIHGRKVNLKIFGSASSIKRIINVYRSFSPQGNVNARAKFLYQLNIIKNAIYDKCILLGNCNLDFVKIYDDNYAHKNLFNDSEVD